MVRHFVELAPVEDSSKLLNIQGTVATRTGSLDQPGLATRHVGVANEVMVEVREPGRAEPQSPDVRGSSNGFPTRMVLGDQHRGRLDESQRTAPLPKHFHAELVRAPDRAAV